MAALLGLTACGSLLDASPDGLQLASPGNRLCGAGSGGSSHAGGAGQAGAGGAAGGNAGAGGAAGGKAGTGNAGQAGTGQAGGAGTSGQGGAGEGGTAGASVGGAAGAAGSSGQAGTGGQAGVGGSSGQAGSGGEAGQGGAAGSPVGSPYDGITSTEFEVATTPLAGVSGGLSVLNLGTEHFQVFTRGEDTQVKMADFASGGWQVPTWTTIPTGAVDAPIAAVRDVANISHVIASKQGTVTDFYFFKKTWLSAPVAGAPVDTTLAACEGAGSSLEVFAHEPGGALRWATVSLLKNGQGSTPSWKDIDASLAPGSTPAAVWDKSGSVHLFVRWSDDSLQHRVLTAGQWAPWENLGGELASSPTVASWAPGRFDVFARSSQGRLQYLALEEGKAVVPWFELTTAIVGAPAAVAWEPGQLRVLARDAADNVIMASLVVPPS